MNKVHNSPCCRKNNQDYIRARLSVIMPRQFPMVNRPRPPSPNAPSRNTDASGQPVFPGLGEFNWKIPHNQQYSKHPLAEQIRNMS